MQNERVGLVGRFIRADGAMHISPEITITDECEDGSLVGITNHVEPSVIRAPANEFHVRANVSAAFVTFVKRTTLRQQAGKVPVAAPVKRPPIQTPTHDAPIKLPPEPEPEGDDDTPPASEGEEGGNEPDDDGVDANPEIAGGTLDAPASE